MNPLKAQAELEEAFWYGILSIDHIFASNLYQDSGRRNEIITTKCSTRIHNPLFCSLREDVPSLPILLLELRLLQSFRF